MVLTLNRSVFCPKDRQQLMGLAAFFPRSAWAMRAW